MFTTLKNTFQKIKSALFKTSSKFSLKLKALFSKPFDPALLEEIERTLYEADLGSECVEILIDALKSYKISHPQAEGSELILCMKETCRKILNQIPYTTKPITSKPHVILLCGVNGSGKTTSCAKLAKLYLDQGKSVILGAADTFRAAAIEQLSIWAERLNTPIVKGMPNGDPASCVFDTLSKAKSQEIEIALIDTAGRLESKSHLMQELEKVCKIAKKIDPEAPQETYLVLDATIGQTAIDQIKVFHQHLPLTGLILTKLDGTAKGGVILSIVNRFKIPVLYVGTGEKVDDLTPFDVEAYLEGLFSECI
jgi:fused signal recognition particle receptor